MSIASVVQQAIGRTVSLPGHFSGPVRVEDAELQDGFVFLRVRTADDTLRDVPMSADELQQALEAALPLSEQTVAPDDFLLFVESARIRLAYAHDPYFALNLTGIEVLPHQLEAVYERMLPRVLLRFLLADDPGAGKTIMAGLLLKELKLRGAVERVLVLAPAPLTLQWRDEMETKFDEYFEVMGSHSVKGGLKSNPWEVHPRCIASIDFAKRDGIREAVVDAHWDLVVIDEAHKCSARTDGDKVSRTARYELAERLAAKAERLVLLTATPHQGDNDQFLHFLRLLEPDQFADSTSSQEAIQVEGNPWYLRRMKEDLRDFDGRALFTKRHAYTEPFLLTNPELELYNAVNDYIERYLPRQRRGRRRTSIALVRMVFQRRLASSLGAITKSLIRRRDRFRGILAELDASAPTEHAEILARHRLVDIDPEQDLEDTDEETQGELLDATTLAERIDDLRDEVRALEDLVRLAVRTQGTGKEAKLEALRECLQRGELQELHDGRGRLLIFTEHRDTLDYLRENLESWGFTTTAIHGGLSAPERREREREFRTSRQVCVATEAAGEGINLQFCHLMINYDMPWNPMRLEQRMGRIHRIGQEYDVHIFNFVAENTVEGQILTRLLEKMETIKATLGDRVYDVIGEVLKLNGVNLEDLLREAAYNPTHRDEYMQAIERIDPERLLEYERAVGIALAKSHVDLARVRGQDLRSEERRLMPEFVEEFFVRAASATDLQVEVRPDSLWRIDHVPAVFRSDELTATRRSGRASTRYPKLTFRKEVMRNSQHLDAELMSPGHPLFAAVDEVLERRVGECRQRRAAFVDPLTRLPYTIHFFELDVDGGTPQGRYATAYSTLSAIVEDEEGRFAVASPDILHDLTPRADQIDLEADHDRIEQARRHAMIQVQHPMRQALQAERQSEVRIRREYLVDSFDQSARKARESWRLLAERVDRGEEAARLARDEAQRRLEVIERRRDEKLTALESLENVVVGPARYLGSAVVTPHAVQGAKQLVEDHEASRAAIGHVLAWERAQGWEPDDVSRHPEGSGFDIRSLGPSDNLGRRAIRRIAVKALTTDASIVAVTPNEWRQAGRHGETYWLYVVDTRSNGEPRLLRVQDPVARLRGHVTDLPDVRGHAASAPMIEVNARSG